MHLKEIDALVEKLAERGYRKLTTCKSKENDTFEMYKAVYYKNGELKYQIFYEFWDFVKYGAGHWGVSLTVMPESVRDGVGRRDLELSVDWLENIDKVEYMAEKFYRFITKIDKY